MQGWQGMTKEEADRIGAVEQKLAALTALLEERNENFVKILQRHDKALIGDHEYPGLGTRVALLEGFSTRAKAVIAAVGLAILGLITNAIKSIIGG